MQLSKVAVVSRDDQFSSIEVYSFDDLNIQGLFSNGMYGKNKVFLNLTELILMVEDCMNNISFPQPMSRYRKMGNVSDMSVRRESYRDRAEFEIPEETAPESWKDAQALCTFKVRIAFRTISGWQGEAECIESERRIKFKSDMEFINFLIDETTKKKARC